MPRRVIVLCVGFGILVVNLCQPGMAWLSVAPRIWSASRSCWRNARRMAARAKPRKVDSL